MSQPMDMPSDAERAGDGPLSTTASGTAGCNLDIEKIHGMSMILLNALGRRQALERCRRQERDAAPANAVARAVREEVERLCAPLDAEGASWLQRWRAIAPERRSPGKEAPRGPSPR